MLQTLLMALFASPHSRHTAERTSVLDILSTQSHEMARSVHSSAGQPVVQYRLQEAEAELSATRHDLQRLQGGLGQQTHQKEQVSPALKTELAEMRHAITQLQEIVKEAEDRQQRRFGCVERTVHKLRDKHQWLCKGGTQSGDEECEEGVQLHGEPNRSGDA